MRIRGIFKYMWWWSVGGWGKKHPQGGIWNVSKQYLETIELLTLAKHDFFPLYSLVTFEQIPNRWCGLVVWFWVLIGAFYSIPPCGCFFPQPPTDHHHWALGLVFYVEVIIIESCLTKYGCFLRRSEAAFDAYWLTPVFEWPCPPSTHRTSLLFIDFWIGHVTKINQSDCRNLSRD